jgi:hypothetical protein
MHDDEFLFLIDLMKIVEKSDVERKGIDDAVISLMDFSEGKLDSSQKKALLSEFMDYKNKRSAKREENRKLIEAQEFRKFDSIDEF